MGLSLIDPITLAIEACGVAILFIWIIVPIQEFRLIARRLREGDSGERASDEREKSA